MVNFLLTHSQISPNYTLPFYLLLLPNVIGKSPSKSNATSMQTSCTCIHFIILGSLAFAYFQASLEISLWSSTIDFETINFKFQ